MKRKRNRTNTDKTVGRRINSADVMILLLFVACIAAMVMRFGLVERIEHRANAQNVNVSFLIEGVSGTSAQYLHIGDEVYLADNDMKAGRISGVSAAEPSVVYVYADDGSILQKQAVDGRVDIRGTLTMSGTLTESGFMLDGTTYIAPNMTLQIKTQYISVSMLITDIQALATETE